LCAIVDGADPHEVFAELIDGHHRPLHEWLGLDEEMSPAPIEVGDIPIRSRSRDLPDLEPVC